MINGNGGHPLNVHYSTLQYSTEVQCSTFADLELLPESEAVQHGGVPLVLQGLQDGGDGGGGGRLGLHQRGALDLYQLVH